MSQVTLTVQKNKPVIVDRDTIKIEVDSVTSKTIIVPIAGSIDAYKFRGRTVSAEVPDNNEVYAWDTTSSTWKPRTLSSIISQVILENAIGDIDGSNTAFETSQPYVAGSLNVIWNGMWLESGVDFNEVSPDDKTFSVDQAPLSDVQQTDVLRVYYTKQ